MTDDVHARRTGARAPRRALAFLELVLIVLPLFALWADITFRLALDGGPGGLIIGAPLLLPGLAGIAALSSLLLPRALGRNVGRQVHLLQVVGVAAGLLLAVWLLYGLSRPRSEPPVLREWPVVWYALLIGAVAVAIHLLTSSAYVVLCRRPS